MAVADGKDKTILFPTVSIAQFLHPPRQSLLLFAKIDFLVYATMLSIRLMT